MKIEKKEGIILQCTEHENCNTVWMDKEKVAKINLKNQTNIVIVSSVVSVGKTF